MNKNKTFTPPSIPEISDDYCKVFLAGSIEMGKAGDWQSEVIKAIPTGVAFLNPRRTDWDSSWTQEIDNTQFFEQVSWELDHLDKADIIFLYFDPATKSPISLLELGLHANSKKILVCCPKGFFRKGNVDIVCKRFGIPMFDSLKMAIEALKSLVKL